jgi:hypothetical protein
MRLVEVLAAAAAGIADPLQLSLLFRNLDDEYKMAVYYKPHKEMEKLQKVLVPEGDSDEDRYRLLGYAGHDYVLRGSDMKFRTGVRVHENENFTDKEISHRYKIEFLNLMGDDKGANLEVESNGYIWIDPGKSHEFFSNENHEFILRDANNKPKVGVTIVDVDAGDEL